MRQKRYKSLYAPAETQSVTNEKARSASPLPATKSALIDDISNDYAVEADFLRDSNETGFFQVPECPKEKKMFFSQNSSSRTAIVKQYTLPTLSTCKCYWYVSFYALDPEQGKLRRKRIRISPKIKKVSERKRYANDLIERITIELRNGWNPWVNFSAPEQYATWQDACDSYRSYVARCKAEALVRDRTWKGYISFLDNLNAWNDSQRQPIHYVYQFDQKIVTRFVDWLWLDKGLSVRTRDNYVVWLKQFCRFLIGHSFIAADPSAALECIGGKIKSNKNRTIIEPDGMKRLKDWCIDNNMHFLLACYILYYCFIRPNEMSYIQIKHISIERSTIFVPDYSSKNGKDGTVTLPDKVTKLMIDLGIFKHPGNYYLFSKALKPGEERHSAKQFTDFWSTYVRKALKFPDNWKFYSLKDTGITDLIKERTDLLSVRNQARHHSLLMTDMYTPHDIEEANDVIKKRKAEF